MTSDDLFTAATRQDQETAKSNAIGSNVPEMSVADLANSLKRTLEQNFSHIRVRGELSGLKLAASGHLYGDIKDVDANINIICWRGTMSKLNFKPEDGMDVIITGNVSSYPKSSRYQIIIEKIELAGEGALLKLLEDRRKKLVAEGLFDANRKKPLPFLPQVIGVVTSPTGAVIRDIMHRLKERFPRHVLLWPVNVQGNGADVQITQAIEGFNALDGTGLPKPDLLIIARGGGSLEDLMAFNEENVVRAVAASTIPVISAIGHETDTTLIDYAADVRAPTPTGAAEIAVPVRLNLIAQVQDDHERLISAATRLMQHYRNQLEARAGRLTHPRQILENKMQAVDLLGEKLTGSLKANIQHHKSNLQTIAANLTSPRFMMEQKNQKLTHLGDKIHNAVQRLHHDKKIQLSSQFRVLETLSHHGVLSRGYALVYDENGHIITQSAQVGEGQIVQIEFKDKDILSTKAAKPYKD